MSKKKLPFDITIYDTEPKMVTNRLSGESIILEPDAIGVYDTIMGGEVVGDYGTVRKGLTWFRRNYPAEYMVLLD